MTEHFLLSSALPYRSSCTGPRNDQTHIGSKHYRGIATEWNGYYLDCTAKKSGSSRQSERVGNQSSLRFEMRRYSGRAAYAGRRPCLTSLVLSTQHHLDTVQPVNLRT